MEILVLIETYENTQCDRLPVTQLMKPPNEKVFQRNCREGREAGGAERVTPTGKEIHFRVQRVGRVTRGRSLTSGFIS